MDTIEVRRLKIVLLLSSLACIVLLVLAAYEENVAGRWREHQADYRQAALAAADSDAGRRAAEAMEVSLRQLYLPALNRVDRCTTCHAGIDDPRMADAPQPIRAHSPGVFEHHPPEKFGCTVCHDGQGRAVAQDAAHGRVAHWLEPMRGGEAIYANCSRCHYENDPYGADQDLFAQARSVAPLTRDELTGTLTLAGHPGIEAVRRGKRLFLQAGCLGCHKYRGRGGTLGPDITYVGDKTEHDFDFTHVKGERTVEQWMFEHFKRPADVSPNTLMPDVGLSDEQARDLTVYMRSLRRKTMPAEYTPVPPRRADQFATGGQLFSMLCSACHGPYGHGSTVREQNVVSAIDAPPELMVPSLNHADTLAVASDDYLRAIVANGRPGTTMIAWSHERDGGLRPEEIDRVVAYIRSWQPPAVNIAEVSATRGDAEAGRAMYIKDCAACHGREGQGGIGVTLNSPTFLAVASDEFLAHTISHGRPNTAMPAWRRFDAQQISDLLAFVRRWQPLRNERSAVLAMAASARSAATSTDVSARIGRTLYDANCVTCHGPDGQGDLAPSLATQEFLTLVDDGFLYDTIAEGRPGTGMPAWRHLSSEDVASLIAYIRTWQAEPSRILADTRVDGDWDTGRFLYAGACASCHGEDAEGGVGPQLNNPVFLRGASDAMLGEWISHGKTGTPMRGFVKGSQGTVEFSPRQVDDLVAFVRSLERRPRVSIAKRPSGRPELGKLWYAVSCASCHGDHGEGASGPALSNPGFLHAASDGFLMATLAMGRDGTEMRPVKKGAQSILSLDSDQVNDLVAYLRSWEIDPPTTGVTHRFVVPWDLERGRRLYVSHCSGCHGENGRGEIDAPGRLSAWAPNLNNTGFLAAASDGFLQATIVRGRDGTAMRSFGHGAQGLVDLSEQDIDDIVAYIRRWSNEPGMPMTIPAGIKTPESDAQAVGGGELHSQQATAPDGLAADATRVPASPLAVHSRTQGDE